MPLSSEAFNSMILERYSGLFPPKNNSYLIIYSLIYYYPYSCLAKAKIEEVFPVPGGPYKIV